MICLMTSRNLQNWDMSPAVGEAEAQAGLKVGVYSVPPPSSIPAQGSQQAAQAEGNP